MTGGTPTVFTIPAGIPFADALARGLLSRAGDDPLNLAAMTILLPSRRAVRAISDAFLRVSEGAALLLPRLMALADLDGDQDLLATADIPPAVDPLRRRLILARLVMSRGGAYRHPDLALRLADALAELIDEVETEQADFSRLAELAPDTFTAHWQATLEFLNIVTQHWPAILEQEGAVDPAHRRVLAIQARAGRWRHAPPADPVIAAGFIAADPALAELIGAVAGMPAGMVVLPGLDLGLDNEGWDAVGATHPQWGLKRLLDGMDVGRAAVRPWPWLLSEALRPAETTAAWRTGPGFDPAACAGLSRLDCETVGEEAEAIALAMRQTLETPGRTAALVTPDRGLARRVAAALARWDVAVDDSAGVPLGETPVGIFLRLIADAAVSRFAPRPLLAMLKHPLAAGGLTPEAMRGQVRLLEQRVLRGPRPAPGIDGLAAALAETPLKAFDGDAGAKQALVDWIDALAQRLAPLTDALAGGSSGLGVLLTRHAEAAEALADTPEEAGALRLWRGPAGEALADLFARLADPAGFDLPPFAPERYPAVLSALMADIAVRPLYGAHPRLAVWGLIEARLQQTDLMILGGLNEGSWPPQPGDEPWMSAPMRKAFGLPPLESRIGQAAQDFALAAAGREVLLTRAQRVDGAPSVPARFLSRLETLLAGSGLALPRGDAAARRGWVEAMDRPDRIVPCAPPEPRPPVKARPRRLSVTAIELWMRDPYALYAQRILKLRALDPIDADPGAADRGKIIHDALDRFIAGHRDNLPGDAMGALIAAGRAAFGTTLAHPSVAAFWWPRFERVAGWFLDFERARRAAGTRPIATEVRGETEIRGAGRPFLLTANADRIDRLADGALAIIDYKTGQPPKPGRVASGLAPQLPLEAVIAARGGFAGVPPGTTAELSYLRLSGGNPPGELLPALGKASPDDAIAEALAGLTRLIALFDDPETPYRAGLRPEFAALGDYDHLARLDEWAVGL
jgi:ATP-dependent helicase/nuclease subunit B